MRYSKYLATVAGLSILSCTAARAQLLDLNETTMTIGATILKNCTVLATPMVFADVLQSDGDDATATSTVTLACTPNATYEVSLDGGSNESAGVRRMKHLTEEAYLAYEIYSDSDRSVVWGDESGEKVSGTASILGVAVLTAYGKIEGDEPAVDAGLYADVVTVEVAF